MSVAGNNFGFSGQWDNFLCIGKKCRQRKAERHKVRMEKKTLKNDQQRAETEALRTDTTLTKQLASPAPQMMTSGADSEAQQTSGKQGIIIIIAGVIVAGGILYQILKKKPYKA